jgi:hypothetical protein
MKIKPMLKKSWHLVTYATGKFEDKQQFITNTHKDQFQIHSYNDTWLKTTNFYDENREILDHSTGAGWWVWKPFILLETIKKLNHGDFVVYCDCGDMFSPKVKNFVETHIDNDCCMLLLGGNLNKHYTKRDCFVLMECDEDDYWSAQQLEAGFMVWKVCEQTVKILEDWLHYCLDFRIVSNVPSKLAEEFPDFVAHRNDQSILTNIAVKEGLAVCGYEYRNFIECDYDYWYERNEKYGFNLGREIDSFLLSIKNA